MSLLEGKHNASTLLPSSRADPKVVKCQEKKIKGRVDLNAMKMKRSII